MPGMDRNTGKALSGWPHVVQSIGVILTTAKMSRVMRRAFGADMVRRVDSPISPATVIDFYSAVAKGIRDHEPRFAVKRMSLSGAAAEGRISLVAEGVYYPRGNFGDFTAPQPQSAEILL